MQNPERRQEEAIDQRQKEGPGGKWRKPKERMLYIKRVAWATESAMPEKRGVGTVVSREAVSGDLSKTFFFFPPILAALPGKGRSLELEFPGASAVTSFASC